MAKASAGDHLAQASFTVNPCCRGSARSAAGSARRENSIAACATPRLATVASGVSALLALAESVENDVTAPLRNGTDSGAIASVEAGAALEAVAIALSEFADADADSASETATETEAIEAAGDIVADVAPEFAPTAVAESEPEFVRPSSVLTMEPEREAADDDVARLLQELEPNGVTAPELDFAEPEANATNEPEFAETEAGDAESATAIDLPSFQPDTAAEQTDSTRTMSAEDASNAEAPPEPVEPHAHAAGSVQQLPDIAVVLATGHSLSRIPQLVPAVRVASRELTVAEHVIQVDAVPVDCTEIVRVESAPPVGGVRFYSVFDAAARPTLVPGWLASLLLAVILLVGAICVLFYVLPGADSPAAPEEAAAAGPEPAPVVARNWTQRTLTKYVEVTGMRVSSDLNGQATVQFLVVNHSGAEIVDATVHVAVRSDAQESPLFTFSFALPRLGPYESQGMGTAVDAPLRLLNSSNWQNLRADVQVTAP